MGTVAKSIADVSSSASSHRKTTDDTKSLTMHDVYVDNFHKNVHITCSSDDKFMEFYDELYTHCRSYDIYLNRLSDITEHVLSANVYLPKDVKAHIGINLLSILKKYVFPSTCVPAHTLY